MQIYENIKLALNSLRTSKLRSVLTLLGISIGLFSIIIVMTAITAIQKSFEDVFNSIGTNNFIIQKYPAMRMGHGHWEYHNRKDLEVEMGEKLKEITSLPVAVGIQLVTGGKVIRYGSNKTNPNVAIVGINLDVLTASDLKLEEGRILSKTDMDYARPVCVLGTDVVDKLFPNVYPIGQQVKVGDSNLQVIGVFEKRGTILGQSQDNFVAVPIKVFERIFGSRRSAQFIVVAKDQLSIPATQDEVIGALRKIRKVAPGKENDFEIVTNDQLIEQFNDLTKYFKIGAGVVAFIALVAAGVGIMNIMLVSVTERTREIGIRKAIGAKKSVILTQFVIEAFVLSQVGGLIGILIGVIGGNIVAVTLGVSVILPIEWILIGIGVTSFVGIVFGVYPAIKASNLDPIEALRYE